MKRMISILLVVFMFINVLSAVSMAEDGEGNQAAITEENTSEIVEESASMRTETIEPEKNHAVQQEGETSDPKEEKVDETHKEDKTEEEERVEEKEREEEAIREPEKQEADLSKQEQESVEPEEDQTNSEENEDEKTDSDDEIKAEIIVEEENEKEEIERIKEDTTRLLKLIPDYPKQLESNTHPTAPSTAVRLTWQAAAGSFIGYQIQSSYTETFDTIFSKTVTGTSVTQYDYTGLTMGQTRYYRVRAYGITSAGDEEYSNFSNIVSFTPGPIAPDGSISASAVSASSVKISWSWSTTPAVSGYYIYRYDYSTSTEKLVGKVRNQLYFDDSGLTLGQKYRYRVYSFYIKNNAEISSSDYAEIKEYISLPPYPQEFKGESASISSIKLAWKAVPEATGYKIYRSADLGANYTLLATVTATTYTDTKNIVSGQEYYYQIATIGSESIEGNKSPAIAVITGPQTPTNFTVKYTSATQIKLEWDKVEDVAGYAIWASTDNITFTKIMEGTLEGHTYVDDGLTVGTGKWYYICSYVGPASAKIYSARTDIVFEITRPLAVRDFKLDVPANQYNQIALTWTASAGAAGYEIHRSTNGTNYYIVNENCIGTSWTNTGLSCGTSYYYKVRPFIYNAGYKYYGAFCAVQSLMAKPAASNWINVVQSSDVATSLNVSWDQVYGANGYSVYYKSTGGTTKYAGGTDQKAKTSFTIKGLSLGETYTIIVRGYRLVNGNKVLGMPIQYDIKLTIPQVINLAKVPVNTSSTTLKWDAVNGADGYELLIQCAQDSNYNNKTIKVTENSYILTNLVIGYDYTCWVRAYIGEEPNYQYGPYSSSFITYSSPETPTNYSAKMLIGSWNVQVTWKPVEGASGYEILRSTTKASGYSIIADVNDGSASKYLDPVSASQAGQIYYYKVRSYVTTGYKRLSTNTYAMEVKVIPPRPTLTVDQQNSTTVQLSWTTVNGATNYYIYRAEKIDGDYTLVKQVTTTSTLCGNLKTGKTYFFKVEAVVKISGNEIRGVMSVAQSVVVTAMPPVISTVTAYAKSVKLTWAASTGATSYTIYYARQGGTFAKAGTTSDLKYTVTGLLCNQPYQFRITASINGAEGKPSAISTITTFVRTPTGLTATSLDAKTMRLSWNASINATGYEIQYTDVSSPTDADYEQNVKYVSGKTAEIGSLIVSAKYHYRVRAYADTRANHSAWISIIGQTIGAKATDLKVTNSTKSTISLEWKGATGAAGYIVYYRKSTDSSYTALSPIEGKALKTYILKGLMPNTGYYIKLRTFTRDPDGNMVLGDTSQYIYAKTPNT